MMQAPPSPYAGKDKVALEEQIAQLRADIHSLEQSRGAARSAAQPDDEDTASAEAWEREPSAGKVLGIGYVRADMPDDIAASLEAQRALRAQLGDPPADQAERMRAMIFEVNRKYGVEAPAEPAALPAEGTHPTGVEGTAATGAGST